ncbi:deformed epidermal autoregulatory factor 1-like isoform X2 [Seriola aureovittata]|uniref:deformed epidermal autoregulatory factor 1-like isoform X2 n=1 Tax=Seriola aureovittata TaxID=2871759 RepID=UPI0024BDF7FF|nr:deformed epidermal autoregulatory factor 1-like isoform X2 [Seriola aureovittata]
MLWACLLLRVSHSFPVLRGSRDDRMKTRNRIISDDEEEREKENNGGGRRNNQRKRKRISYIEDHYADEGGREEDEEDNEQLGPSAQSTRHQRAQVNRMHVTCGGKEGILDVEKLGRSEDCIQCESHWFSPSAFEDFAGKGFWKKWKSTIFHKDKPLQTLFEKGILTTQGYNRRRTDTTKPKNFLLSISDSESSSEVIEIQSEEELEDDDVLDEDWVPSREELVPELEKGEEEEEEEEGADGGEAEDEDVPAVTDNGKANNVFEEMETHLILSTSARSALQPAVVVLKRLRKTESDRQSSCTQHSQESWCQPLEEGTQSEEEREHDGSAIDDVYTTANIQTDTCQMSGIQEERSKRDKGKDGQTEIKTETGNSPRSASATSSKPDTVNKPVDTPSISGHTANASVTGTQTAEHCGKKEEEQKRKEHLDTSSSEADVQPSATVNVRDATSNTTTTQDESTEATRDSTKPQRAPVDDPGHTGATTCGRDEAQLQVMNQDTRDPQTARASDTEGGPSSRRSASINLDTLDLDQLKREKIKMQMKVLKLQEEYYTLKIQEFRK